MKLTYSNVVATTALFVALGGGAYAAIELDDGSVKNKHLANHSIGKQKLRSESVSARKIGDSAVGRRQVAGNAINEQKLSNPLQGALAGAGRIVARITNAGSTSSPTGSGAADVPIQGGSWTQGAGELQQLFGRAFVRAPEQPCRPETFGGGTPFESGSISVAVQLDGRQVASGQTHVFTERTAEVPLTGLFGGSELALLYPPDGLTEHQLTVEIRDNCIAPNEAKVGTLTDLDIVVVGVG